jgi:prolyl oligopeptidase
MRLAALLCLLTAPAAAAAMTPDSAKDPNLWLEAVSSPAAMDWVKGQNARSLGVLQGDPHYETFYQQALAIGQAQDRVPVPAQLNGQIFNFWQDADHVRGLWRRTTLDDFRTPTPHWAPVLDVDALAKAEHANWVWKGANCLEPEERLCLLALSDGGEDAVVQREFDAARSAFAANGFSIPHAKMDVDWESADAVLIATDWGPGSMTQSGYPFIVKRLRRGEKLADASEVFRGTAKDVRVVPTALSDGQGNHVMLIQQGLDFFHSAWFRVTPSGVEKLALPEKIQVSGLLHNKLVVMLEEPWARPGATPIPAGSLAVLDMGKPGAVPEQVFVPGPRQSLDNVAVTRDKLVAAMYDNVRGRILIFTPGKNGWKTERLALPDNVAVDVVSTSIRDNRVFLDVNGFLTPGSLWFADLDAGPPSMIKQTPPRFDASRDVVEQFEATSSDGTKIPYFVVRPKAMKADGSNPTLLYAYGGFQISEVPKYSGVLGKLWLEHGGVYVLANIRGGGEFGPAWHEAALKTHRQRAYDDFAAVAKDIIARKITSPRRLGIEGGSNGGLLMGVEFEQHPDLWGATVIQVPLLDMLRFEQIAAGASWVGEYGTIAKPEQRAFLARISPYANLRAGVHYPMPFIYTTTKDDRVGPQHARKFAAKMAALHLPYLYYEAIEGGHSAGANAREQAQEKALEMTYLTRQLME